MTKRWMALLFFFGAASSCRGQSSSNWFPSTLYSESSVHCPGDDEWPEIERMAAANDVGAQDRLGTILLSTCKGSDNAAQGAQWLKQAADAGNTHAQLTLGEAYRDGKGVEKDPKQAAAWFAKAAAAGDFRAQNNLGVAYAFGAGVEKDERKAVEFYASAAENGLPEARFNLGTMYDQGKGVTRNYETARKWYAKAAEKDVAQAEFRLGMMNEEGIGGAKDSAAATEWFKKAASHGSEDAKVKLGIKSPSQSMSVSSGYFQYAAGIAMIQGKEVAKDEKKGILFLQKAAEAGYPPAMLQLGIMFGNGQGTEKDELQAEKYFQQAIAADAKYSMAFNDLAWLYVTADDPKIHNAQKALELAKKAVDLDNGKNAYSLDTLAHAYFELGQMDLALENETVAAKLDPKNEFIQKTLAEYTSAKEKQKPTN